MSCCFWNPAYSQIFVSETPSVLGFLSLTSNWINCFIGPFPLALFPSISTFTIVLFCYTNTKASNIRLCSGYSTKVSNAPAEACVLLRLKSVINSRFTLTRDSFVNVAKVCSKFILRPPLSECFAFKKIVHRINLQRDKKMEWLSWIKNLKKNAISAISHHSIKSTTVFWHLNVSVVCNQPTKPNRYVGLYNSLLTVHCSVVSFGQNNDFSKALSEGSSLKSFLKRGSEKACVAGVAGSTQATKVGSPWIHTGVGFCQFAWAAFAIQIP